MNIWDEVIRVTNDGKGKDQSFKVALEEPHIFGFGATEEEAKIAFLEAFDEYLYKLQDLRDTLNRKDTSEPTAEDTYIHVKIPMDMLAYTYFSSSTWLGFDEARFTQMIEARERFEKRLMDAGFDLRMPYEQRHDPENMCYVFTQKRTFKK